MTVCISGCDFRKTRGEDADELIADVALDHLAELTNKVEPTPEQAAADEAEFRENLAKMGERMDAMWAKLGPQAEAFRAKAHELAGTGGPPGSPTPEEIDAIIGSGRDDAAPKANATTIPVRLSLFGCEEPLPNQLHAVSWIKGNDGDIAKRIGHQCAVAMRDVYEYVDGKTLPDVASFRDQFQVEDIFVPAQPGRKHGKLVVNLEQEWEWEHGFFVVIDTESRDGDEWTTHDGIDECGFVWPYDEFEGREDGSINKQLWQALTIGNGDYAEKLIGDGADPHACLPFKTPFTDYFLDEGNYDAIRTLLRAEVYDAEQAGRLATRLNEHDTKEARSLLQELRAYRERFSAEGVFE